MNWVDYLFIGIITISTILGLLRGLLYAAFSLFFALVAFYIARNVTLNDIKSLLALNPHSIALSSFAIGIFIIVMWLGLLLIKYIKNFMDGQGLSLFSVVNGAVLGFMRGVVIVAAAVFFTNLSSLAQNKIWQHSLIVRHSREHVIEKVMHAYT